MSSLLHRGDRTKLHDRIASYHGAPEAEGERDSQILHVNTAERTKPARGLVWYYNSARQGFWSGLDYLVSLQTRHEYHSNAEARGGVRRGFRLEHIQHQIETQRSPTTHHSTQAHRVVLPASHATCYGSIPTRVTYVPERPARN